MAEFSTSSFDGVGQSSLHGFGVFAVNAFMPGDLVFNETPLLRLQSLPNRSDALVCGFCFRFLGSVGMQLGVLSGQVNRLSCEASLRAPRPGDLNLSDILSCGYQCGELYCSEICRSQHWEKCHSLLCTGCVSVDDADNSPLIAFKQYAVSTNEILLMVGDVFAEIFSNPVINAGGEGSHAVALELVHPFQAYVHQLWWDAAVAPDGTNPDELTASLREIVVTAWDHLNTLFGITSRNLQSVLSAEFVARLIGMFEQNNVGIRLQSPVAYFIKNMKCSSPLADRILLASRAIVAAISEGFALLSMPSLPDDVFAILITEEWDDVDDDGTCSSDCSSACGAIKDREPAGARQHESRCAEGSACRELHDLVAEEGEDRLYPPLDGTAFYRRICHMNVS